MRRAARIDDNQPEIVRALRDVGAEVTHLHTVGKGCADLLVSYRQRWFLLEVKDGDKPPSAQALTDDEKKWIAKQHAPVHIVRSPTDAVGLLNILCGAP